MRNVVKYSKHAPNDFEVIEINGIKQFGMHFHNWYMMLYGLGMDKSNTFFKKV